MSARRKPAPPLPPPIWLATTAEHTRKVIAPLTESQARHLRALARRLNCLTYDSIAGHPLPSTRSLVQALASGALHVTRKKP